MNHIKFNKEKLEEYVRENKKTINKIFSDEENLKKLENNDFINLYCNIHGDLDTDNNPPITAVLLLSDIDFLSHLDTIPTVCFFGLDITTIIIPDSVTSIGKLAFYECSSLESVVIGNSVTSIGDEAFRDCTSLINITIPNSVTSIEYHAFNGCSSLTNIAIPNSVTSIDSCVFFNCTSLISITIPNSITRVEHFTFANCASLESIIIPDSVTRIGDHAFYGCIKLTSITFEGTKNQWEDIDKNYDWRKDSSIREIKCIDGIIKL